MATVRPGMWRAEEARAEYLGLSGAKGGDPLLLRAAAAEECRRRRAPFGYQRYGDHRRRRRPHHQSRAWLHFISVAAPRFLLLCRIISNPTCHNQTNSS